MEFTRDDLVAMARSASEIANSPAAGPALVTVDSGEDEYDQPAPCFGVAASSTIDKTEHCAVWQVAQSLSLWVPKLTPAMEKWPLLPNLKSLRFEADNGVDCIIPLLTKLKGVPNLYRLIIAPANFNGGCPLKFLAQLTTADVPNSIRAITIEDIRGAVYNFKPFKQPIKASEPLTVSALNITCTEEGKELLYLKNVLPSLEILVTEPPKPDSGIDAFRALLQSRAWDITYEAVGQTAKQIDALATVQTEARCVSIDCRDRVSEGQFVKLLSAILCQPTIEEFSDREEWPSGRGVGLEILRQYYAGGSGVAAIDKMVRRVKAVMAERKVERFKLEDKRNTMRMLYVLMASVRATGNHAFRDSIGQPEPMNEIRRFFGTSQEMMATVGTQLCSRMLNSKLSQLLPVPTPKLKAKKRAPKRPAAAAPSQ